jgi:serine/threonine protein kinase
VNGINQIGRYFNIVTTSRLEETMGKCVKNVTKALHDQLVNTMKRFSNSRLRAIIKNIDEKTNKLECFSDGQMRSLTKFIEKNKLKFNKLYLDLMSEQFKRTYPDCQITNRKLGAGNFEIYSAVLPLSDTTKRNLTAKKVPLHQFNVQEIRYLKQLDHPNIVKYYSVLKCLSEEEFYYIIMNKMDGDRIVYISLQQKSSTMNEDKLLKIFRQITETLCYIY